MIQMNGCRWIMLVIEELDFSRVEVLFGILLLPGSLMLVYRLISFVFQYVDLVDDLGDV